MKKPYSEAIIFFGILIPVFFIGLTFFLCSQLLTRDKNTLIRKAEVHRNDQIVVGQVSKLKTNITGQLDQLNQWNELLESEPSLKIMGSLKESSKVEGQKVSQSSFSRSRATTFASEAFLPSTAWDFTLRGSFRALQHTFLALEEENPHLFLEQLEFSPNHANNSLTSSATYSAWTIPAN